MSYYLTVFILYNVWWDVRCWWDKCVDLWRFIGHDINLDWYEEPIVIDVACHNNKCSSNTLERKWMKIFHWYTKEFFFRYSLIYKDLLHTLSHELGVQDIRYLYPNESLTLCTTHNHYKGKYLHNMFYLSLFPWST